MSADQNLRMTVQHFWTLSLFGALGAKRMKHSPGKRVGANHGWPVGSLTCFAVVVDLPLAMNRFPKCFWDVRDPRFFAKHRRPQHKQVSTINDRKTN